MLVHRLTGLPPGASGFGPAQYAFGVKQAIYLASKLKHPKVTVIEFGVASGDGLQALEKYAAELGARAGIEVEV